MHFNLEIDLTGAGLLNQDQSIDYSRVADFIRSAVDRIEDVHHDHALSAEYEMVNTNGDRVGFYQFSSDETPHA